MTRDTWDGDSNRPLSFNRWNYVFANPVNATDPTGNIPCEGIPPSEWYRIQGCPGYTPSPITVRCLPAAQLGGSDDLVEPTSSFYTSLLLRTYGVQLLDGSRTESLAKWDLTMSEGAFTAVVDVANRVGGVSAFRSTFHTYSKNLVFKKVGSYDCGPNGTGTTGGCTQGDHLVEFAKITAPGIRFQTMRNNIVHEMGHVFDNNHPGSSGPTASLASGPAKYKYNRNLFLHDNSTITWQQNRLQTDGETFADMFLAFTYYGVWKTPIDTEELAKIYKHNPEYWDPPQWMNNQMKHWIGQ